MGVKRKVIKVIKFLRTSSMQVFTLLSTFFKGNLNFHTQCSKFLPQILIFKSGGVNCKPLIFQT